MQQVFHPRTMSTNNNNSSSMVTMELSTRAKAFSVEALLQHQQQQDESATTDEHNQTTEETESLAEEDCSGHSPSHSSPARSPSPIDEDDTSSSTGVIEINDVSARLCSRELWKQFHRLGTEMIITKAGRRMFPSLKIRLSGLDPEAYYAVWLDIVPVDDKRYRYVYHSSQWMVAGSGDPPLSHNTFVHPDSPAPGRTWMEQGPLGFDRLKLTNNRRPLVRGQISLHSMHKYQPRIHMRKVEMGQKEQPSTDSNDTMVFAFSDTVFTTVTAYQNQQITRLKIASNPFAKGFREATKTRETTDDSASPSYSYSPLDPPITDNAQQLNRGLSGLYPAFLPSTSFLRASFFPMIAPLPPPGLGRLPDPQCRPTRWFVPGVVDGKLGPRCWPSPKMLDLGSTALVLPTTAGSLSNASWPLRDSQPVETNALSWTQSASNRIKSLESLIWPRTMSEANSAHPEPCWSTEDADANQWKQQMVPDLS